MWYMALKWAVGNYSFNFSHLRRKSDKKKSFLHSGPESQIFSFFLIFLTFWPLIKKQPYQMNGPIYFSGNTLGLSKFNPLAQIIWGLKVVNDERRRSYGLKKDKKENKKMYKSDWERNLHGSWSFCGWSVRNEKWFANYLIGIGCWMQRRIRYRYP